MAMAFFGLGFVSIIYGSVVVNGIFNDPFALFYYIVGVMLWGCGLLAFLSE